MTDRDSLFDAFDREASDAYGNAGNSTYWLRFCQRAVTVACTGRRLHRACDSLRILVDTFESESLGGSPDGLDRLSDREWLNLRERVTENVRAAAQAARDV